MLRTVLRFWGQGPGGNGPSAKRRESRAGTGLALRPWSGQPPLLALLLEIDPEAVEAACVDPAARGPGGVKHAKAALQRFGDAAVQEQMTGMLKAE